MHAHPSLPAAEGAGRHLEVADIFRAHAEAYACARSLPTRAQRVLQAVRTCRTAELGGHLDVCDTCGVSRPSYNSCRDRHCPTCQASKQFAWIEARRATILPVPYFHVVFTLPAGLRPLARANARLLYDILFRAASETLQQLGRQRLDAQLGITLVLHTWTREMLLHPHVHGVVTGGGLSSDGTRWVGTRSNYLFPVPVMRKLFRGKVLHMLRAAFHEAVLHLDGDCASLQKLGAFRALLRTLRATEWVVYAKKPFAGPEQVFSYLGRYTHRVAISSARLRVLTPNAVTFATRGNNSVTLTPHEFIRRFLLHVLPPGFRKLRHYGLHAPGNLGTRLAKARTLLPAPAPVLPTAVQPAAAPVDQPIRHVACPLCKVGQLRKQALIRQPSTSLPQPPAYLDSS